MINKIKKRDKKFLRLLAKATYEELRQLHVGKPFRLSSRLLVRATGSEGWAVSLGSFVGYKCSAEVWIDKFTGHPTRKVYYTLSSSKPKGIAQLAKEAKRQFGKHLEIYLKHWDQKSDFSRLAKRLAKVRFGRPVYERYPKNHEYFYGIYELDRTGLKKNEFTRLVDRVTGFFQTIAESSAKSVADNDYDNYKALENRLSVARHIRRERKSHAGTLRKQKDNYICQICHFNFSKKYPVLGEDFAEAHHIVPLAKNKIVRSTLVDDLITVCANCHRMLHRLSGGINDIDELRQIVKSRKRK